MPTYRMYFRNSRGAVGRDEFETDSDASALMIARLLSEACSDMCAKFGLWEGARRLHDSSSKELSFLAEQVNQGVAEEIALQRMMAIRDGGWLIAESRRLLDRIARKTNETAGGR